MFLNQAQIATIGGNMDEYTRGFHTEEYKQLRTEVTGLLARIELLFRYSIVVVATVFAWLLTNSMGLTEIQSTCIKLPKALLYFGWLIPPAFVICAGLMAKTTNNRVTQIGKYLRTLEDALGEPTLGWEKYLAYLESILTPTTQRIWWLLFTLSSAASITGLVAICRSVASCTLTK